MQLFVYLKVLLVIVGGVSAKIVMLCKRLVPYTTSNALLPILSIVDGSVMFCRLLHP